MPAYRETIEDDERGFVMARNEEYVSLPLFTMSEAAKYLGVGRRVLYQLIEWGEIRTVKMRGTAMVEKRSLDDYRASGRMN